MSPETALSPRFLKSALRRSLRLAAGKRPPPGSGPTAVVELTHSSVKAVAAGRGRRAEAGPAVFHREATAAEGNEASGWLRDAGTELGRFLSAHRVKDFVLVLASSGVRSAIVEVPALSLEDTADALGLKAAKLFGGSAEGWQVAATPLGGPGGEKKQGQPHLLVAVAQADMDRAADLCRRAGRLPGVWTVPPVLYGSLFAGFPSHEGLQEDGPVVWVVTEIRRDVTSVNIYCDGALQYTRQISIGGGQITAALMDVVATPEGMVELSLEEAESLKRSVGFPTDTGDPLATSGERLNGEQIRMMLEPKLKALVFEIRNSIRHFQQKSGHHCIYRLVFTGGGSRLRGLDEYVQENLKIRPYRLRPSDVGFAPGAISEEAGEFLCSQGTALFAALRQPPPALNLVPPGMVWERRVRVPSRLAAAISLIAAAVLAVVGVRLQGALEEQRRALRSMEGTRAFAEEAESLAAEVDRLGSEISELTSKTSPRIPLAELVADLSRRLPPRTALTQVIASDESGPGLVSVKGRIPAGSGPEEGRAALHADRCLRGLALREEPPAGEPRPVIGAGRRLPGVRPRDRPLRTPAGDRAMRRFHPLARVLAAGACILTALSVHLFYYRGLAREYRDLRRVSSDQQVSSAAYREAAERCLALRGEKERQERELARLREGTAGSWGPREVFGKMNDCLAARGLGFLQFSPVTIASARDRPAAGRQSYALVFDATYRQVVSLLEEWSRLPLSVRLERLRVEPGPRQEVRLVRVSLQYGVSGRAEGTEGRP